MSGESTIIGGAMAISAFPFVLAILLTIEDRVRARFGWTSRSLGVAVPHIGDFLWLFTVMAGLVINEALKQTYAAYEVQGFSTTHWYFLLLFIVVVVRYHLGILPYFRKTYVEDSEAAWRLFSFDFATRMCQYVLLFWASQGLKTNNVRELFFFLLLVMAANLTWYWGVSMLGGKWLVDALAPWAHSVATITGCFLVIWLAAGVLVLPLEPGWPGELVGSLIYAAPLIVVALARFWNMQGYIQGDTRD
jgi:hypothetical protein